MGVGGESGPDSGPACLSAARGGFPPLVRGSNRSVGGYAFDRSWEQEDERLLAVERQLDPVSQAVVHQLGLATGWRCWEAGAGGGSMARWLADRVSPGGCVVASDIDVGALAGLDHGSIQVIGHDLERDGVPG